MWLKVGRLLAFRVSTMSDYQALKHKLVMFPYSHINDNIHSLRVPTRSDDFLAQHIFGRHRVGQHQAVQRQAAEALL